MAKKDDKKKTAINPTDASVTSDDFFGRVLAERNEQKQEPENTTASVPQQPRDERWLNENYEGQLAVDVYQTADDIVIQSTVAGVRVEDLDISVNNDMVTIRGVRRREQEVSPSDYFYQECYWGGFSRSIILPFDVRSERVTATLKNGILTIVLPKADKPRSRSIRVREKFDDEE